MHPRARFMPWQQLVANRALEVDPRTGRLVHREVNVLVPRRGGKTLLVWAGIAVHRCRAAPESRVWLTAQTGEKARNRWMDLIRAVRRSRYAADVASVKKAAGREILEWRNGSTLRPFAPVEDCLDGEDSDLVVLDECQAFTVDEGLRIEESARPTLATRPNPQVLRIGTLSRAPGWFDRNLELAEPSLTDPTYPAALFAWQADRSADPTDPAVWAATHPALGHLIAPDFLEGELLTFGLESFALEYLCVRASTAADDLADAWDGCRDPGSTPGPDLAWAVDVAPDRRSAAVAVASLRPDGTAHVELVDHRPGTLWLGPRLVELVAAHRPRELVVDPYGPVGGTARAHPRLPWREVDLAFYTQACEETADRVRARRLAHLGQPTLAAAVRGAARRKVGERWAWSRVRSDDDVTPLVAVTLAVWAAVTRPTVAPRVYNRAPSTST